MLETLVFLSDDKRVKMLKINKPFSEVVKALKALEQPDEQKLLIV